MLKINNANNKNTKQASFVIIKLYSLKSEFGPLEVTEFT